MTPQYTQAIGYSPVRFSRRAGRPAARRFRPRHIDRPIDRRFDRPIDRAIRAVKTVRPIDRAVRAIMPYAQNHRGSTIRSGYGALGNPELGAMSYFWMVAGIASVGASAYHGYKRNNSVGWAIVWGLLGGLAPVITPAVAVAQGFGERKRG